MDQDKTDVMGSLLAELECVVCAENMQAPIYLCSTGHNICKHCRQKLAKCGLCQSPYSGTRNLSLESLAALVMTSCPNKPYGCPISLQGKFMDLHKSECSFRFKCIESNCEWQGCITDLRKHWLAKRHVLWTVKPSAIMKLNVTKDNTRLIQHFSEYFWLKQRIVNDHIYWLMLHIGSTDEAKKYRYTVEIVNPICCRSVTLTDACLSIDSTLTEDFLIKNICTYINGNQARLLSARQTITIGLNIQKNQKVPQMIQPVRYSKKKGKKNENLGRCKSLENLRF